MLGGTAAPGVSQFSPRRGRRKVRLKAKLGKLQASVCQWQFPSRRRCPESTAARTGFSAGASVAWQGHAALLCLQQELCTQQESLGARSMLEFSLMNPFMLDHGFSLSPHSLRFCCAAPRGFHPLSIAVPTAAPSWIRDPGATSRSPRCPCLALGVLSQPGSSSGSRAEEAGAAG